jgi:hypothetical protein
MHAGHAGHGSLLYGVNHLHTCIKSRPESSNLSFCYVDVDSDVGKGTAEAVHGWVHFDGLPINLCQQEAGYLMQRVI